MNVLQFAYFNSVFPNSLRIVYDETKVAVQSDCFFPFQNDLDTSLVNKLKNSSVSALNAAYFNALKIEGIPDCLWKSLSQNVFRLPVVLRSSVHLAAASSTESPSQEDNAWSHAETYVHAYGKLRTVFCDVKMQSRCAEFFGFPCGSRSGVALKEDFDNLERFVARLVYKKWKKSSDHQQQRRCFFPNPIVGVKMVFKDRKSVV